MNTIKRYRFPTRLSFVAPIISQAAGAIKFGLDAAHLRDRNGNLALPGTLIQGNLLHYWGELYQEDMGLGAPSRAGEKGWPNRGRVGFSEFWSADVKGSSSDLRYRIKINEDTGRTDDGALQMIESTLPSGTLVTFSGEIYSWFNSENEAREFARKLAKVLRYIPAMGAFKGIGFGRIKQVEVKCSAIEAMPSQLNEPAKETMLKTGQLGLVIKPDRAFCFSRHLVGNSARERAVEDSSGLDNQYVSEDFIPGGAIKGAIATFLRQFSDNPDSNHASPPQSERFPLICTYLDQITISHAQPCIKGRKTRGQPLPKSVVYADDRFFDISMTPPGLINDCAPLFSTDWKSKEWTRLQSEPNTNLTAYMDNHRSLVLHTGIDRATGASLGSALFSIEAVVSEDHEWLSNLTLPGSLNETQTQALVEELRDFFALGLHWLGKTEASAEVEMTTVFESPERNPITPDDEYCTLMLCSDACLLPVGTVAPSTNGGHELQQAYAATIDDLSQGSLELVRTIAQQKLVGGTYLHKRFGHGNAYNPAIFTEAGSVFVMRIKDEEKAIELLAQWKRNGLPQISGVSEDWRSNPYIGANGYGEIAINSITFARPRLDGENP